MALYEHTVIARPDLSAQQAQTLSETLGQLVADQGGSVAKTEYWGLRNLTYRMKKHRKGHFLHFNLEVTPAALAELERNERIHEDVVRYLSVKVDRFEEGASQVMVAKSMREERSRRDRDDDRPRRDEEPRRERDGASE